MRGGSVQGREGPRLGRAGRNGSGLGGSQRGRVSSLGSGRWAPNLRAKDGDLASERGFIMFPF